jgi:hypothetical protein
VQRKIVTLVPLENEESRNMFYTQNKLQHAADYLDDKRRQED